jgi:putative phage-type endonuclease
MEQRSAEWFQARKGRITGSIVGAVLGLSPWMNKDDVMRSMVRSAIGAESEFTGNVATEYGQRNEEGAIFDFELKTGLSVQQCGFYAYGERYGASPDGLIDDDAILEVKCPFGLRDKDQPEFKTADEQPHYKAQMMFEMLCTGRTKAYFYQWAPAGDYLELVQFDPLWIEQSMPALDAFYEEYLKELKAPDKHLAPLIVSLESRAAAEAYKAAKAHIELAEKNLEAAKNRLIEIANGNKSNISGLLVYPVQREGAISYAKVVKDHLSGVDLEPYRGKPTSYWTVK